MNSAHRFRQVGDSADNRINWMGALIVALLALAASALLVELDGGMRAPGVVAPAAVRAVAAGVIPAGDPGPASF